MNKSGTCTAVENPLCIDLPHPPTVNTYWRSAVVMPKWLKTIIGKRPPPKVVTYLSEKGREYKSTVDAQFAASGIQGPLTGRLRVVVLYNAPDARQRDIENYLKATMDALTEAGAWDDDSQIDDLRIVRGPILKGGKVTVHYLETEAAPEQGALMLEEPPPF